MDQSPPPELPLLSATLEFRRSQRLTSKPHHPSTSSQFMTDFVVTNEQNLLTPIHRLYSLGVIFVMNNTPGDKIFHDFVCAAMDGMNLDV